MSFDRGQKVIAGKSASHWSTTREDMYVGYSLYFMRHSTIYKAKFKCTIQTQYLYFTYKFNVDNCEHNSRGPKYDVLTLAKIFPSRILSYLSLALLNY